MLYYQRGVQIEKTIILNNLRRFLKMRLNVFLLALLLCLPLLYLQRHGATRPNSPAAIAELRS